LLPKLLALTKNAKHFISTLFAIFAIKESQSHFWWKPPSSLLLTTRLTTQRSYPE